jgi:hypothetical protein
VRSCRQLDLGCESRTRFAPSRIRLFVLMVMALLLPCELIGKPQAGDQVNSSSQEQADAKKAIDKIKSDCGVDEAETNPKKINKQINCVARAVAAQRRKIVVERSLRQTVEQAYGVPKAPPAVPQPQAPPPPPPPPTAPGPGPGTGAAAGPGPAPAAPGPTYAGASASNTPSTCGQGTGSNNPLIRVHRLLMAPKNASDDFGYRLGRRYIIYQVTISNDNKDYQYLIHDVSLDLSVLFHADPGTYLYAASSQDLTLLRGIPEKGQDLDKRNLIYHVLQGIGSVGGAVSGLTSFSDVMGSSVAAFNGPFLQSYVGIAPDHTGTQLNRLSDSAYITNTVVDKQRAKTIAIFIPEATILSREDQKAYWKDPYAFLQTLNLDQADVCVDGAFITTIAPPTLTSAVLTPKTAGASLGPNVQVTLTVQGTNLTAGDTQVFGLGTPVALTNATGTTGSVDLTLPSNYTAGMSVHLASAANPSLTSATIATTTSTSAPPAPMAAPTLTSAVLAPKTTGTPLGPSVPVTLTVQGTNLVAGDTQVVGLGPPVALATATATTGSLDLTLPSNYTAGMSVHLASAANPSLTSATIATTTSTSAPATPTAAPTLTSAVLTPKTAGTHLGPNVQATLTVQGTNLTAGDTQVIGLGAPVALTTATGTTGTVDLTLPSNYTARMSVHLASVANPSLTSATIPTSTPAPARKKK